MVELPARIAAKGGYPAIMWLLLPGFAHAFCGTFVGSDGSTLTNSASQVVLARDGTRTTLTLAMDYTGDLAEFALVLPVPSVLGAEDVAVVDAELLARVDQWSMPREVAYTCEDLVSADHSFSGCGTVLGCATDSKLSDKAWDTAAFAADAVSVESSFSEAGYDFVVLSAEASSGLLAWLDENGYSLPAGGEDVLQEYIDAGSYFLAARVSLDATGEGNRWLPPIQLTYESDAWSLPIRIGTISADGPQEVIVYALNREDDGEAAISNYPQVEVEDECMRPDSAELGPYYQQRLDEAFAPGAGWLVEYSWDLTANCDPCTTSQGLTPDELAALGLEDYHGHLTRLRMHYTPEQATQDLQLYNTNRPGVAEQIRFIRYAEELEYLFPICGEGFRDDPGTCLSEDRAAVTGCNVPAVPVGGLSALAALLLARRRRA